MDFFGDYSIETASCHPSSLTLTGNEDDVFAPSTFPPPSPMTRDSRTSCPTAFINMTHLSRAFSLQTLDTATIAEEGDPSSLSPSYSVSSPTHLQIPSSPLRRTSISSARTAPCWKRRMQRQRDIRMLAEESHLKSIADLVQRMVDSNDQCGIVNRRDADLTPTPATPLVEDGDDYFGSSDSGSPRSLSSSSSNGRRSSYFAADFVSPTQRRPAEAGNLSMTFHNSKVCKSRARRGPRR